MTKLRVGLLFGGCSGEHEVSVTSAKAIAAALSAGSNPEKYEVFPVYIQKNGVWKGGDTAQQVLASGQPLPADDGDVKPSDRVPEPAILEGSDVWFPILHGPNGEDGTVQGLLTLMGVPFVGAGVLGSAVGMDKIAMKTAFTRAGLPQVRYQAVRRSQVWSNPCVFPKLCDELDELGYPCFVKPANLGSSVGISKVRSRSELEAALDTAATYDRRIIVEAGVEARELECAVLGNDYPKASVVGEITYNTDFYDYETKYTQGQAELLIPAPVDTAIASKIRDMAIEAFLAVDCAGMARVDFFYVEKTGEILINEINTLPGFTALSMYPQLWAATGIAFPELVDKLIELAVERKNEAAEERSP